jgi:O-antigen/teichoic acid export membrane protein
MIALAFGLISLVTLQALTTALLVRRRSVDVAAVAGATLGVKLIIVWPLVDRWGPLGAGLAVLLAYTTQAGLLWWRLARYGGRPKLGLSLVPAFVACLVMTPVLLSGLPLIPAGLIAAGLYCGSWWALAARLDADSITRLMATFGR